MGAVRRALQVREVGPDGRAVTRVVAVLHPYRVPEDSAEALQELSLGVNKNDKMENPGFDPGTSRMLSGRSAN